MTRPQHTGTHIVEAWSAAINPSRQANGGNYTSSKRASAGGEQPSRANSHLRPGLGIKPDGPPTCSYRRSVPPTWSPTVGFAPGGLRRVKKLAENLRGPNGLANRLRYRD